MKKILLAELLLMSIAGCQMPRERTGGYQRFIQIRGGNPALNLPGSLALDTETGHLCKTYEWHATFEDLPLCADLYRSSGAAK
jgi:hypothetical protein